MMPVWSREFADKVGLAILHQKGQLTKAQRVMYLEDKLLKPLTCISYKGVPRWRHHSLEAPIPIRVKITTLDVQAQANCNRWLTCPKCAQGMETVGKALFNDPETRVKNGVFAFLTCSSCKRQLKTGNWKCCCQVKWHSCTMHSSGHLEGKKRKYRSSSEVRSAKVARSLVEDMPDPVLRPLAARKRTASAASTTQTPPDDTVGCETRKKLKLPPSLAAKFPHLVSDA